MAISLASTSQFSDLDGYRLVPGATVEFTPLSADVGGRQVILHLPGLIVSSLESFPRTVDLQLGPDCTKIGLMLDDGVPQIFNGITRKRFHVSVGGGGAGYSAVEQSAKRCASVVFVPEVKDRGWPVQRHSHQLVETTAEAYSRLRQVLQSALEVTVETATPLELEAVAVGIRESLLAACDRVFLDRVDRPWNGSTNLASYRLFQRIEEMVTAELGQPIYNGELAERAGISVRTLHNTFRRYRGMSLHRYLSRRRLWLVRRQLLAGEESVKAAALTMGFWHMGEFARVYKRAFGELPSETQARAIK